MTIWAPPGRSSSRTALPGLAAGATLFVAYLAVAPGAPSSVTAANDLVQMLVPLVLTVPLATRVAHQTNGRARLAWILLALGAASWGLGQAVWTWFEVVRHEAVPYPGPADVGFVASIPLLLAGVLLFPSDSLRSMGRLRAVVDGCITLTALLFAGYGTFLGVIYREREGGVLAQVLAVTYPSADIVILAVVLAVVVRRTRRLAGPLPWIAGGVFLLAIADGSFAYLTATGSYASDPVTDAGWPLGFACLAYAACVALRRDDTARPDEASGTEVAEGSPLLGVILPNLAVMAAGGVFAARAISNQGFGPFLGTAGGILVFFVVVRQAVTLLENRDLTRHLEETVLALRRREAELQFQAFHDPLTALANRALFRDRLEHALSPRRAQEVAVLFIDLDDFKVVNDTLGHDTGDRLLGLVAERLRACVRPGDTVARLGGDEFAILVDGESARIDGTLLAERILAAFDVPFAVRAQELDVSASVGLAAGSYDSAEEALKDADIAMYAAKDAGKGRVEEFSSAMREPGQVRRAASTASVSSGRQMSRSGSQGSRRL